PRRGDRDKRAQSHRDGIDRPDVQRRDADPGAYAVAGSRRCRGEASQPGRDRKHEQDIARPAWTGPRLGILARARGLSGERLGRVLINRPRPILSNDVRCCTNSGRKADIDLGPLRAKSGLMQRNNCAMNLANKGEAETTWLTSIALGRRSNISRSARRSDI